MIRALDEEIKNYREEVSSLQSCLDRHKCSKGETDYRKHCLAVQKEMPSQQVTEHEVPVSTTAEDIVHSLDELLSGLDDDRWCEELQQGM